MSKIVHKIIRMKWKLKWLIIFYRLTCVFTLGLNTNVLFAYLTILVIKNSLIITCLDTVTDSRQEKSIKISVTS